MRMIPAFFGAVLVAACFAFPGALHAADHAITQKDKTFSQEEITVKAGDTITFTNQDDVTHNIYSKDEGNEFEVPKQDPGQKETITLKKAGDVKIRCAIHPKMKMTVKVQ